MVYWQLPATLRNLAHDQEMGIYTPSLQHVLYVLILNFPFAFFAMTALNFGNSHCSTSACGENMPSFAAVGKRMLSVRSMNGLLHG